METRQIHVRDLSTVTGIQQFEHEVQSIYFLGLEDFVGTIYLSIESDDYSNEAIPLTSNTFIIGQPMTLYNTTYTCQIYGVLNDGEKIQLSKRFRLIVDKSNDIQGESSEYPIDPNFENSIVEFVNEQKAEIDTYTDAQKSEIEATGEAVFASIPSDYSTLEQATYNAYPTQSETGNPIYIDDGADDIPVKELIVNLEPKQEGEGDPSPSNVRAISGYDGVVVKRTGKNLLPMTLANLKAWNTRGTWNGNVYTDTTTVTFTVQTDSNGLVTGIVANGTGTNASVFYIKAHDLKSGNYIVNGAPSGGEWSSKYRIRIGDKTDAFIDNDVGTDRNIPVTNGLTLQINTAIGYACNNLVFKPMIRLASATDSTFEPYQGQEYSITFPSSAGTVYGGSLNVTTGVLTMDRRMRTIDGNTIYVNGVSDASTTDTEGGKRLTTNINGVKYISNSAIPNVISDKLKAISSTNIYSSNVANSISVNDVGVITIRYGGATTVEQANTALEANPIQVCYPLATPFTYQLTPTEVSTLLGNNTISSDGSMDLIYRADTTKVIEKLTNAIISMGGNV